MKTEMLPDIEVQDVGMAMAALHTYRRGIADWAHNTCHTIEAGGMLADIYYLNRTPDVLIAVRGTASIDNWATNIDFVKIESDYLVGYVHRGFANASKQLTTPLKAWCEQYLSRESTVHLCGHSLGGAVVQYLTPWLHHTIGRVVRIDTYGSPRIGDKEYAAEWSKRYGRVHRRWVNSVDAVPHIPPLMKGFRPTQGLNYFNRKGELTYNYGLPIVWDQIKSAILHIGTPGIAGIEYHDMYEYVRRISDWHYGNALLCAARNTPSK